MRLSGDLLKQPLVGANMNAWESEDQTIEESGDATKRYRKQHSETGFLVGVGVNR